MTRNKTKLVRVQERGQVTIPAALRRKLGVSRGDYVAVVETPEGVLVTRPEALAATQSRSTGSTAGGVEPDARIDGSELSEDLRERLVCVLKRHGVEHAGVFGSFARGEADSASDIDILIDRPEGMSLFDLVGLKQELEEALGRSADVVTYKALHPLLRERVLAEQQTIL